MQLHVSRKKWVEIPEDSCFDSLLLMHPENQRVLQQTYQAHFAFPLHPQI